MKKTLLTILTLGIYALMQKKKNSSVAPAQASMVPPVSPDSSLADISSQGVSAPAPEAMPTETPAAPAMESAQLSAEAPSMPEVTSAPEAMPTSEPALATPPTVEAPMSAEAPTDPAQPTPTAQV